MDEKKENRKARNYAIFHVNLNVRKRKGLTKIALSSGNE